MKIGLKRLFLLFFILLFACVSFVNQAYAGRRGLHFDDSAWNAPEVITKGGGSGACPEAGWNSQVEPGPTLFWGWVHWMNFEFMTSAFLGLATFTCQTSKPFTPGADPLEYLNEAIFPLDEADLGAYIGANTHNEVHAIRYSYTGEVDGVVYGRQWTFYIFSNGETVVALNGVQPAETTYEWIYDHTSSQYSWNAQTDLLWDGYYFCFNENGGLFYFSGTCEPAPEPLKDEIFGSSFEGS